MRVGLIARADRTGLGQGQTLRLARMLQPDGIMLINSRPFNNNDQHFEWYTPYRNKHLHIIDGFPSNEQIRHFLEYVDVVISCETFYNNDFTQIAKELNKKTILIANYEFFDWHTPRFEFVPLPDKVVMPSLWHIEEMSHDYNAKYLPTPLFEDEFRDVVQLNINRKGKRRYLFINGRSAIHDRNGLWSIYEALKLSTGKFELVIKAQGDIDTIQDPRVKYDLSDEPETAKLYEGFDAMFLPRRYAGQSLPMTEALVSGLPVIMTDISPNNQILPSKWLVPANRVGSFMTRTSIDIFAADPKALANVMDTLKITKKEKLEAVKIGRQFLSKNLKKQYEELVS